MAARTLVRSTMLVLSESDVRKCLDMSLCIDINRSALISIATGDATVPSRLILPYRAAAQDPAAVLAAAAGTVTTAADCSLFKPASLQQTLSNREEKSTVIMGVKVVSVRAMNPSGGHPLVPATILHMNPETGMVDAVLDGTYLTAARTAAGSAVAIQHYFSHCNNGSSVTTAIHSQIRHVVVFGAGMQAEQHVIAIHAICMASIDDEREQSEHGSGTIQETDATLFRIPRLTIVNRTADRAQQLSQLLLQRNLVQECRVVELHDSSAVQSAVREANVIVTCTNTSTPLWHSNGSRVDDEEEAASARTNCIIAGIGSYTPHMQEVPTYVVNACRHVWIDTMEATSVGDLCHLGPSADLLATSTRPAPIPKLLGSVLLQSSQHSTEAAATTQDHVERQSVSGLCFYKAVGTAIQDVVTAAAVVERAKQLGIGTHVNMS
jgi:ornithine cyclodeaminase